MAVCPTDAVTIAGLSYGQEIIPSPAGPLSPEEFQKLITTRRSVRVFQNKPVPRELLEKIVEAISLAPMGFPPHRTEITIVSTRARIEKALPFCVQLYSNMNKWLKNPLIRYMIKRKLPPETFNTIISHVMPSIMARLPIMQKTGKDIITRGAQAMLLFHADRQAEMHTEDIHIATTYALLAAHALGLGATAIGLIPPVVNKVKEVREIFQIPEKNEAVACVVLGYPQHSYPKSVRRKLRSVTWLE
jgi:nitroreductase